MSALPAFQQPERAFLGVTNSATGRVWRDRCGPRESQTALAIHQRHGLPEILARIIASRGIALDEVENFLDPSIRRMMPDPSILTDMDKAAERLADAVEKREKIAIFGDYDVDGATSTALLVRVLRATGIDPLFHIPDRLFEGYGPNIDAVRSVRPLKPCAAGSPWAYASTSTIRPPAPST